MKKCSKCGIEKDESEFDKHKHHTDGLSSHCKQCRKEYRVKNEEKIKKYRKEYYDANKEKIIERNREYVKGNIEKVREKDRRWRKNNPEKVKEKQRNFRKNHPDEVKEHNRLWELNNPEKVRERHKRNRKANPDKYRDISRRWLENNRERFNENYRKWSKTPKGKEYICRKNNKRRELGHEPINKWFKGSEAHHLRYTKTPNEQDNDITLYIPRKLHRSILHNGNTGKNMKEINVAALEWYFENTHDEERNPKAVKLYWNYCMFPEPEWTSNTYVEQIT